MECSSRILPFTKPKCSGTSAFILSRVLKHTRLSLFAIDQRSQILKSCVSQITVKGLGSYQDRNQTCLCFLAKDIDVFRQLISIFMIFGEFQGHDQLQKGYWT